MSRRELERLEDIVTEFRISEVRLRRLKVSEESRHARDLATNFLLNALVQLANLEAMEQNNTPSDPCP